MWLEERHIVVYAEVRACGFCGYVFQPKKPSHRFCQSRCRSMWHKQSHDGVTE